MKHLSRPIWSVACILLSCAWNACGQGTPVSGWPAHHGDGGYGQKREGIAWVDKAADARLAWMLSRHMGVGKTNAAVEGEFFGGSAGVVTADGVAYTSFIRPAGEVLNEKTENRYYRLGKHPRSISLIDGDDVTVAVDIETGRELWVAEEHGASMNFLFGKRGHFGVTPVVGGGVVYVWGPLGNLYAYDAKTGQKKWQSEIPAYRKQAVAAKEKALANKAILDTYGHSAPFGGLRVNLVLAGDVLVAPNGFSGLIGFDAATGKQLWERPTVLDRQFTPSLWRHGGKSYLICGSGSVKGKYTLIDSTDGKVVWTYDTAGPAHSPVVVDGDIAILNTKGYGAGVKAPPDPKDNGGVFGGFQLSLEGPRQLWVMDDVPENWFVARPDTGRIRHMAARDGIGYFVLGNLVPRGEPPQKHKSLVAVDLKTGKVIHRDTTPLPGTAGTIYVVEDRVLVWGDLAHLWNGVRLHEFKLNPDGSFNSTGAAFQPANTGVLFITEYESPMEFAWWKGRMIGKARQGLACLDFRRP